MGEKLFRFVLSELTAIRLRCPRCSGVVEIPTDRMATTPAQLSCPGCGLQYVQGEGTRTSDLVADLGRSIAAIHKAGLDPEFVIPDRDDPKKLEAK